MKDCNGLFRRGGWSALWKILIQKNSGLISIPTLILLVLMSGCASSGDVSLKNVPRGMTVITEDEFYDVEGGTVEAIRASLRKNGPAYHGGTVLGLASWRVSWTYRTALKMGQCEMEQVEVNLHLTITLPHWQPPENADSLLFRYWEKYLEDLAEHEEGHRTIAIEMARDATQTLWSLRPFSCADMAAHSKEEVYAILDAYKEKQQTYDRVYKTIYWPPKLMP